MNEFQARIADSSDYFDIPLEANSRASALLMAHRARIFIQEQHGDKFSAAAVTTLTEVIRHDKDFVEHQMIWSPITGFVEQKETNS